MRFWLQPKCLSISNSHDIKSYRKRKSLKKKYLPKLNEYLEVERNKKWMWVCMRVS